jgi:enoyl-CoA hydratase/carnithine racemase
LAGLRIERPADGVALVVLDRPARLNAFDDELLLESLPNLFGKLDADDTVRCAVLTGAGRGFSAGADLDSSGFAQPTAIEAEQFTVNSHRTPVSIRRAATPSIAAINGPAVGAGLGLALACDIRFAGADARLGAPFVTMGLVPDFGVSYFLPRIVGTDRALELLLTGRLLDAQESLELGLVSRIVDDVVGAAVELATTIASMPPWAVTRTRANVYRALELGVEAEVLELEPRSQGAALHGSEFRDRFSEYRARIMGADATA